GRPSSGDVAGTRTSETRACGPGGHDSERARGALRPLHHFRAYMSGADSLPAASRTAARSVRIGTGLPSAKTPGPLLPLTNRPLTVAITVTRSAVRSFSGDSDTRAT